MLRAQYTCDLRESAHFTDRSNVTLLLGRYDEQRIFLRSEYVSARVGF